jgi:hypothetical protein
MKISRNTVERVNFFMLGIIACLVIITIASFLSGCTANFVMRGNLANYQQRADTEGKIKNEPWSGDSTVAAEKTTDAKLDLPIVK